jgi:hypothetical protein
MENQQFVSESNYEQNETGARRNKKSTTSVHNLTLIESINEDYFTLEGRDGAAPSSCSRRRLFTLTSLQGQTEGGALRSNTGRRKRKCEQERRCRICS